MKVVKFGGSSLADGEHFAQAIKIITTDPQRRVVVTSAPGKRTANDTKVTDLLIKYAQQVIAEQPFQKTVTQIIDRYTAIADYFNVPQAKLAPLAERLNELPNWHFPNNNYLLAAFKAHGERFNAQLMTIILQSWATKPALLPPNRSAFGSPGPPITPA